MRGSPMLRVPVLELVAANLTRWEDRHCFVECILKLQQAGVAMKPDGALHALLLAVGFAFPIDFMCICPIFEAVARGETYSGLAFLFLTKGDVVADLQGRTGEERAYAVLCPKVGARHASHVRLAARRRQHHEIIQDRSAGTGWLLCFDCHLTTPHRPQSKCECRCSAPFNTTRMALLL